MLQGSTYEKYWLFNKQYTCRVDQGACWEQMFFLNHGSPKDLYPMLPIDMWCTIKNIHSHKLSFYYWSQEPRQETQVRMYCLMHAFVVHIIVMLDEVIIKLVGCGQPLWTIAANMRVRQNITCTTTHLHVHSMQTCMTLSVLVTGTCTMSRCKPRLHRESSWRVWMLWCLCRTSWWKL